MQRWGTFSVTDHLRRHSFVAEVLLYDRLVVPHPPDEAERDRWLAMGWVPGRLDNRLELLGDLAIRVPWDDRRREQFQARYAAANAVQFDVRLLDDAQQAATAARRQFDPERDAMYVTRTILTNARSMALPDDLKAVLRVRQDLADVAPVAAYPSAAAFQHDYRPTPRPTTPEHLGFLLAHRFLAPRLAGRPERDTLKEAVALARDEEFRALRAAMYAWQATVIERGLTELQALDEMEGYVREYNARVRREFKQTVARYVFTAFKIAASKAPALLLASQGIPVDAPGVKEGLEAGAEIVLSAVQSRVLGAEQGQSPHAVTPEAMFRSAAKRLA